MLPKAIVDFKAALELNPQAKALEAIGTAGMLPPDERSSKAHRPLA